jgi:hypothetical protein
MKRDGQVWAINHNVADALRSRRFIDPSVLSTRVDYMDGIEWRALVGVGNFDLGVKANGTLWAAGHPPWNRESPLIQIDPGTNWQTASGNFTRVLALKTDGTLWKIDVADWNHPPQVSQVGKQSDWRAIAGYHDSVFATSADGDIWRWGTYAYRPGWIEIAPSRIPTRVANILQ